MKPAVFKLPKVPTPQIDRINRFKGINVSVDPTQLEYNESPDMLNMTLDTEGALDKRTGYAKLFPTALGGTVWSAFDYRKSDGTTEHLLHAGTKLYRMAVDGTQPTEINNTIVLNGSLGWEFSNDFLGFKRVRCLNAIEPNTGHWGATLTKYNGSFLNVGGSGSGPDTFSLEGTNSVDLYIHIADADSGWGEGYTPTQADIKAYFNAKPYRMQYKHSFVMANARSNMFAMAGKVYIQDGTNYLEYDGTTVKEPDPYVPTVRIATPPAGGGEAHEDFNLLTGKFMQSFSGDASATIFNLTIGGLDATPVTATVNLVAKTEGTDFTVNRTTGVVTFTTAPPTGVPSNVVISASKTVADNKQQVTRCRNARIYGGTNDTRVFMWYKNILQRSDVFRPNYYPENANQQVGGDDDIQNMVIQYDTAVIEKEFSKWSLRYEQDSTGRAIFPIRPINDTMGSIAPLSSQIILNSPVSLTKNGVYILRGGSVRDERNVSHQSRRIDKLLLAEPNLKDAITIDFDNKYCIFLNGKVFVWDYTQTHDDDEEFGQWYPWDNFPATSVWEIDSRLYFGDSAGNVYYLKKHGEFAAYRDIDQGYRYRWISKQNAYGTAERRKLVEKLVVTIKPASSTSAEIYYITDQVVSPLVASIRMDSFDFTTWDFERLTFITNSFPQPVMTKIKAKKIVYFQVVIEGEAIDESLGLLSIETIYSQQSLVK